MASLSGIKAGAAYVELFVKDSKLAKGLQSAAKKLKAFGQGVSDIGATTAKLGAAVLAPLLASAKIFSSHGDQLAKMSQRTGVSVESLSELAFAAERSGSDVGALDTGLARMQRTIVDAGQGMSTANDSLGLLNLTFEDFRGLTPDEQFKLIADRISKVQSPAVKTAAAMQILGRGGAALLPLMNEGAQGIENLQQEARALGLTLSSKDAKAAEAFNDVVGDLITVAKRAAFAIGAALAPSLTDLAQWLIRGIVTVTRWIEQNRQVIVTVLKVAAAVTAGGLALVGLGYVISGVGTALGVLAGIVGAVGTVLGAMASVVGALLTPIGLVVAAVASLGAYLLYATGAGAKALSWLGQRFGELKEDAGKAYQGIADALAAGDITLAARILWLTLKMEWLKGIQPLQAAWLKFRGAFLKIAYDAFYGALAAFEIVQHGLEVGWIETTAFLAKAWETFTNRFQSAWATAVGWTEQRLHDLHGLMDSTFDSRQAKGMAQQNLEATQQKLDQQLTTSLQTREDERKQTREQSDKTHQLTMAYIGQESIAKEKALKDEYSQRIQSAQDELLKTRQEWEQAIAEAKAKRAATPETPEGPPRLQRPDLLDQLGGLDEVVAEAARSTVDVSGTFNAMAARGLGTGDVTDRIAQATQETAQNTKKLLTEAQLGGLSFI